MWNYTGQFSSSFLLPMSLSDMPKMLCSIHLWWQQENLSSSLSKAFHPSLRSADVRIHNPLKQLVIVRRVPWRIAHGSKISQKTKYLSQYRMSARGSGRHCLTWYRDFTCSNFFETSERFGNYSIIACQHIFWNSIGAVNLAKLTNAHISNRSLL